MARDYYDDSYEEYEEYEERDDSYEEYEEYEERDEYDEDECSYQDAGNDWTEEDSWDALTGGMYGDMPNNPLEYDAMMDALGF